MRAGGAATPRIADKRMRANRRTMASGYRGAGGFEADLGECDPGGGLGIFVVEAGKDGAEAVGVDRYSSSEEGGDGESIDTGYAEHEIVAAAFGLDGLIET